MRYKTFALGAAVLLVIALADLPYGYYTFLRVVVCGVAALGAVKAHGDERGGWTLVLVGVALLFNPIIPVYFDRETWALLDVASAVIVGVSAFSLDGVEGEMGRE
jgi:hypothetical protein